MIEVNNLSRFFGPIRAVDGLNFMVPKGQICGFLGPNGAGKSTTMKILSGYLQPSLGKASLNGIDIVANPHEVKKNLGYLPESCPLYGEMSVKEFLAFIGEVRLLSGVELTKAMDRVKDICQIKSVWFQPIETLSKGYRQRVGFAQALIHNPPILILDEPTDGLDPNQKHEVRELIKNMGHDKTILLSTHILEEVEAVCQRALIIAHGKLVLDGNPLDLLSRSKEHNALLVSFGRYEDLQQAREHLAANLPVEKLEVSNSDSLTLKLYPKSGRNLSTQFVELAKARNWDVYDLKVQQGRLDEVFRDVTTLNH